MTTAVFGLFGALFGVSVASVSGQVRPWLPGLVGAVAAVLASLYRHGGLRPPPIGVRILALMVLVKVTQVVTGGRNGVDVEFVAAALVGVIAWGAAAGTMSDLEATARGIDTSDGLSPLQRIRMRATSLAVVAVVCAAWGLVGVRGLVDLRRPAVTGMSHAPFAYVVVSMLALGVVAYRAEARRWQRDGATVDPDVPVRWMQTAVGVVALAAVSGMAVTVVVPGASAVPARGLAASGRVGEWVNERLGALGEALDTDAAPGAGDGGGLAAPAFEPVEPVVPWVGDVALWLMLAGIFAWVIVRARRWKGWTPPDEVEEKTGLVRVARLLCQELVEVIQALVTALARLWRRTRGRQAGAAEDIEEGLAVSGWRRWIPGDPIRRRIADAYEAARGGLVAMHGPARLSETPGEFADRMDTVPFTAVTRLYEEARYSDHILGIEHATAAEDAARRIEPGAGT